MLWKGLRRSKNVTDNRKLSTTTKSIIGAAAIVGATLGTYFVNGPTLAPVVVEQVKDANKMAPARFSFDEHRDFVSAVLGSTEDVWKKIFVENKLFWRDPKLVLFTGSTKSACGDADSDIGPFYCSGDMTVYIDLDFFKLLEKNLGAPGDTPQSYVVSHEMAHHVQNLLKTLPNTHAKMQRSGSQKAANQLLVKLELQADCYAGIWMHHVKHILEPGDLAEAVNSAARIGDDWLQTRGGGVSMPDSFTHGTANQRAFWLLKGYQSGKMQDCDTFAATSIDIVK